MRQIVRLGITLGLLAGLAAVPAAGQPAVQDLIQGLQPEAGQRRGIRVPAAPPPSLPAPSLPAPSLPAQAVPTPPAAATAMPKPEGDPLTTTTAPPGVAAVALTVTFATGSARLTPAAEQVLENLGRALTSPQLAPFRFRVEGHTDTVGAPAMNQALSDQRAAAVRDWLLRRHGIDPRRLEAIGFGEQQLLVPTRDETPEPRNRRVQVLNIGG